MQLFRALLILGQGIALTRAACNADNCARAVTGTQKGLAFQSTAKADCSSFFKATVFPTTVTKTEYTTVFPSTTTQTVVAATVSEQSTVYPFTERPLTTVTTVSQTTTFSTAIVTSTSLIPGIRLYKRDDAQESICVPSLVPTYASACSGVVRYSSACSCFGASKTTVTMPTPTTVTTLTVTGIATGTQYISTSTTATLSLTTTIPSAVTETTIASLVQTYTVRVQGYSCPQNYQICGAYCYRLDLDWNNCGACGHRCNNNQVCGGGTCH